MHFSADDFSIGLPGATFFTRRSGEVEETSKEDSELQSLRCQVRSPFSRPHRIWKYFSGLQLRYSDCNKIRLTAVIALYNLQNYNTRNVANHSQHILYFLESPTYQTTHYVQPLSTFFLCSAQNPSSSSLKQHRFQGFIFYYPIFQF